MKNSPSDIQGVDGFVAFFSISGLVRWAALFLETTFNDDSAVCRVLNPRFNSQAGRLCSGPLCSVNGILLLKLECSK